MTTAPKFRRKNSCPDGWLNAGAKVPIRLTVRQEEYCRQAIDIHRFCYNLAVRTHRFAAGTGYPGPAGRTSARPSTPASGRTTPSSPRFRLLSPLAPSGTSAGPWTTGGTPASAPGPKNQASGVHRHRFLPGGRQHEGDPLRRKAEGETPLPGQRQAGLHPAQGHLLRSQHQEGERPLVHLPKLWRPPEPKPERADRPGGIDTGINPLGTDSDGQTTGIPKPPTRCRKTSGDGSGPRPGDGRDPGAGGKPSGRSTSASGASGDSGATRSTR